MRVGRDTYSGIFYAVHVLMSLQFFKVSEYGHAELYVFSGLFAGVNVQVEYRKSASLIELEIRLSSNMLMNQ